MLIGLKDLKRRLQEIEFQINTFEEVLNNSLKIEGNQTVYGKLKFKDVAFSCSRKSCQFNTIQTVLLNEDNITDWSKNLIFLDRDQVIDGTLFVENITANDINVSGMIDGIDSSTLVTRFGNHNITGPKVFNTLYVPDLEVHGLVDGVKISPDNVLLTTGHQIVNGNLTFGEIDASWLEVEGMVNGVNLIEFYSDVVLSDQPSVITGKKTFHDIVVDNIIMNPGSTINGVDFKDLWENALWVDGSQRINAQMTFNSMELQKNLYVSHGINGIQIPGPRVVSINEFANVTAPHFFKESTIAQLNVMKSLNGLETLEIPGKKTLPNIHLDADSTVQGTVNGVDLSEFKNMVLSRHSSKDPNSVWRFNNLKIKGPLAVKNINGLDIGNIYERALKLDDTDLPEMTFEDIVYGQRFPLLSEAAKLKKPTLAPRKAEFWAPRRNAYLVLVRLRPPRTPGPPQCEVAGVYVTPLGGRSVVFRCGSASSGAVLVTRQRFRMVKSVSNGPRVL
ncbi:tspear [Trichonephila clavipes]|nr:tspear [Trichonephila clavipes]